MCESKVSLASKTKPKYFTQIACGIDSQYKVMEMFVTRHFLSNLITFSLMWT